MALAYALTGGLIRVVNLENGDRSLLRSHTADVCDVQVRVQCSGSAASPAVHCAFCCRCAGQTCFAQLPWTASSSFSRLARCVKHTTILRLVSIV